MNRTIKDATVKRYHYEFHDQLVRHLADCVAAYNFARPLKTLRGLTPYEFICKRRTKEPERGWSMARVLHGSPHDGRVFEPSSMHRKRAPEPLPLATA